MNISPLKITRAMEEDIAENKATKLVSLQGEHFSQSAVEEFDMVDRWVELYDDMNAVVLGDRGTVTLCRYEYRDRSWEKIGEPVIKLQQVPDLVDAAHQVAKIYYDPSIKPMEFKAAIEKLTEILEAANYVVKEA